MAQQADGGRAEAKRLSPSVSRETWARLEAFIGQLEKWQKTINLVAPGTLPGVWTRHVADGVQVAELVPAGAKTVVDLGSGGGFPGLVVAAMRPDVHVHLIESDQRKSAFLREAARAMRVPATVHNARIESALAAWPHGADVVTARALSPLPTLIGLALPLLKAGTVGIFPKGREIKEELAEAEKLWTLNYALVPSRTDPEARLVVVTGLTPR
jgi:16S rRNA (guanine527-N7)-methyltransferase